MKLFTSTELEAKAASLIPEVCESNGVQSATVANWGIVIDGRKTRLTVTYSIGLNKVTTRTIAL